MPRVSTFINGSKAAVWPEGDVPCVCAGVVRCELADAVEPGVLTAEVSVGEGRADAGGYVAPLQWTYSDASVSLDWSDRIVVLKD